MSELSKEDLNRLHGSTEHLLTSPTFIVWSLAGLSFVTSDIEGYMKACDEEGQAEPDDRDLPAPPASYLSSFCIKTPVTPNS